MLGALSPRESPGRPERRKAARFLVGLPVKLEDGEGRTRDVSSSGVFLTTRAPFSTGAFVKFVLELEHVHPNGRWPIACEGQVVRVEPLSDAIGLAIEITSCDFNSLPVPDGMPERRMLG